LQPLPTLLTGWPFALLRCAPIRLRTHLDHFFQQARTHLRQPLVHGFFDFPQGRSRVLLPPFLHPDQQHQAMALFSGRSFFS
jgi:hypothetical protein